MTPREQGVRNLVTSQLRFIHFQIPIDLNFSFQTFPFSLQNSRTKMIILNIRHERQKYFNRNRQEKKKRLAGVKHDWNPRHLRKKIGPQEAALTRQEMRDEALKRLGEK